MKIIVHTNAAAVEQAAGHWATVEPITDTTCRLLMNVHTLADPATILAIIGANFDVIEPPELRDYLHTIGQLFVTASATLRSDPADPAVR